MEANDLIANDHMVGRRVHHLAQRPVGDRTKSAAPERLRCADVARNRAARYARQHRVRKLLWPLITAAIMIGLIFERRPSFPLGWTGKSFSLHQGDAWSRSFSDRAPDDGNHDLAELPSKADSTESFNEEPKLEYRLSANFLVRDVSQMIAFLIRNRGRLDNNVVRAKWKLVDEFSLPLAVYLREIESLGAWGDLDREISAVTFTPSASPPKGTPRSVQHQKIASCLAEWQRRGETLLSTIDGSGGGDGGPKPNVAYDDSDDPSDDKPRAP